MFAKSTTEGEAGSGRRRQSRFGGKGTKATGERLKGYPGRGEREEKGRGTGNT